MPKTPSPLQAVINQLDRIGAAEADRWEPYYYQAFGYLRMSGMQQQMAEKDKFLELALAAVAKGEAIQPNDAELESMRGYIVMMQLVVDPASRGMTHSGMAFASFQKAIQLDPSNPRAHYLLGRMQYGTAQFMGGGNEEACQTLSRAKALFAEGATSENPFAPNWGAEGTEEAIKEICSGGE